MGKVVETLKHEFMEMVPPTIYFFVILHIAGFVRVLMNKGSGLPLATTMSITVAALVLGKSVLIANALPFINRFPEKPLMYNVLWKTVIYVAVSLLAHYLEHLVPLWWRMGSFAGANEHMWAKIVWPHFWAIQLWLVVLIFVYCAMRELVRVIGRQRVIQIFLGTPTVR